MSSLITVGRFFLVLLFIVSGSLKLIDVAGTAQMVSAKVIIPGLLSTYVVQIESITGFSAAHFMAVGAGLLEIICGVMIGFGLGVRSFSIILVLYIVTVTYFFHDFWNYAGAERFSAMFAALKNLSLIGALLILMGVTPRKSSTAADTLDEY